MFFFYHPEICVQIISPGSKLNEKTHSWNSILFEVSWRSNSVTENSLSAHHKSCPPGILSILLFPTKRGNPWIWQKSFTLQWVSNYINILSLISKEKPNPSEALPIPHHNLVQDLGQPCPEKKLPLAMQRQPWGLGCDPGEAAAAIASAFLSYASETTITSRPWLVLLSAPPTPHHSLARDLGQTDPGGRVDLGTQRRLRGLGCGWGSSSPDLWSLHSCFSSQSHKGLIPTQPSKCSSLTTPWHSLALDLEWTQQWKGHNLGLCLSGAVASYIGSSSDLCEHTSLTYFSSPVLWGKTHTQREKRLLGPDPLGYSSSNLKADLTPERAAQLQNRKGVLPHTLCRLSILHQPHSLPRWQWPVHIEESCGWCPHQNQTLHKDIGHTMCIGILPHKNSSSKPQ